MIILNFLSKILFEGGLFISMAYLFILALFVYMFLILSIITLKFLYHKKWKTAILLSLFILDVCQIIYFEIFPQKTPNMYYELFNIVSITGIFIGLVTDCKAIASLKMKMTKNKNNLKLPSEKQIYAYGIENDKVPFYIKIYHTQRRGYAITKNGMFIFKGAIKKNKYDISPSFVPLFYKDEVINFYAWDNIEALTLNYNEGWMGIEHEWNTSFTLDKLYINKEDMDESLPFLRKFLGAKKSKS